jgi:hypothetical protein
LVGEPDENALGASDVTEPIDILALSAAEIHRRPPGMGFGEGDDSLAEECDEGRRLPVCGLE